MSSSHLPILHEITPLMSKDALYIADRKKTEFDYPIHNHDAFELNFVAHAAGVRRIVGDSSEVIGDYDLVLITSPSLEHVWEQGDCKHKEIREITIQFNFGTAEDNFFSKNPFDSIVKMMDAARKGLCFPMEAILKIFNNLNTLSQEKDHFQMVMRFLNILYTLSQCEGAHTLATSSYAKIELEDDSRRILKVKNYINDNYMEELKLKTLADVANMSESAFSRFFKIHTGRTLSEYITDIRMGFATRRLVDSTDSIAEISFQCGYNNLSNFNRTFRRKKGCSPSEFRENYHKVRRII